MNKLERRFIPFSLTESRIEQEGDNRYLSGLAVPFNRVTDKMGWREVVRPGAFTRALRENQDVCALINHDPNLLLGRTESRTLGLTEEQRGLAYRIDMPPTSYAQDAQVSIQRGDMRGCSFAFRARPEAEGGQRWKTETAGDGERYLSRELLDVDLSDISIVTYPAYDGTSVKSVRDFSAAELRSLFPEGVPEEVDAHLNPPCDCGAMYPEGHRFAGQHDPYTCKRTAATPPAEGPGEAELLRRLEAANLGLLPD